MCVIAITLFHDIVFFKQSNIFLKKYAPKTSKVASCIQFYPFCV